MPDGVRQDTTKIVGTAQAEMPEFYAMARRVINSPLAQDTLMQLAGIRPDSIKVQSMGVRHTSPSGETTMEAGWTPLTRKENMIGLRPHSIMAGQGGSPEAGIERTISHELAHLAEVKGGLGDLITGFVEQTNGNSEQFARAFEEAVEILRKSDTRKGAHDVATYVDQQHPGTLYITAQLIRNPLFRDKYARDGQTITKHILDGTTPP